MPAHQHNNKNTGKKPVQQSQIFGLADELSLDEEDPFNLDIQAKARLSQQYDNNENTEFIISQEDFDENEQQSFHEDEYPSFSIN
jgi:hypothetical protein